MSSFTNKPKPAQTENKSAISAADLFKTGKPASGFGAKPIAEKKAVEEEQIAEVADAGDAGLVLTTCFKLAVNGDQRLTTGCDILTDFFRGGFVPKKLYEIYGESGSGKTQFSI
jgi:predicted ATP-dependent serine protease